jgi:hypothetical protein
MIMTDKNQQEDNDRLLTSKEAIKIFIAAGLSEPTFRRRVRQGRIKKRLPEGRTRGALYPESQVRLAALEEKATAQLPRKHVKSQPLLATTFSKATPNDMPEMAVLLETFYNAKISVVKRAAWIERNPDIAYILRSNGKLVGCAFIMPLSETKIMQILSSQVKPATRPQEIELYEPGKHVYLYVRAAGVLQSVSKVQRKYWAAKLIVGLVRMVIELGSKGIYVEKVYTQGDTVLGEKALKMLGFAQIDINAPTDRKNFMLDINQSGAWAAMHYKRALLSWRAQNEEE